MGAATITCLGYTCHLMDRCSDRMGCFSATAFACADLKPAGEVTCSDPRPSPRARWLCSGCSIPLKSADRAEVGKAEKARLVPRVFV